MATISNLCTLLGIIVISQHRKQFKLDLYGKGTIICMLNGDEINLIIKFLVPGFLL
jgi:hypothetical protein